MLLRHRYRLLSAYIEPRGIPLNAMTVHQSAAASNVKLIPPSVGAFVGILAMAVNRRRKLIAQANGWCIWSGVCIFGLAVGWAPATELIFFDAVINTIVVSFIGWTYLLVNWASAPKGQSWLIWRGR